MRFFFIFVFAIMFIVKSGVSSSLHHDLFHKMKYHSSNHHNFKKEVNFSNCHEQKENEKPLGQSHCEIVCLCSHFSSNINFFLTAGTSKLYAQKDTVVLLRQYDLLVTSLIHSPPKPPPKYSV